MGPPQSTSVSWPSFWWSMHWAATQVCEIASQPPLAVQTTKRLTYESFQNEMIVALELASSQAAIMSMTDDHKEAVTAFREKRRAIYKGA